MLVVHGGPGMDHSYFLPQMEALAQDRQLIFYDQRASGRSSDQGVPGIYSVEGLVGDLEGVRESLELEKVHLMGHSWGAWVALQYAIRYPGRLRSLILVSPGNPSSDTREAENALLAARMTREDSLEMTALMATEAFQEKTPEALADWYRIMYRPTFHDPNKVDQLTLAFEPGHYEKAQALNEMNMDPQYISYDLKPFLHLIKCPVLLIYGESDPMKDLSGPTLETYLLKSKKVVLPESGHFPFVEQPEAFMEAVEAFLE